MRIDVQNKEIENLRPVVSKHHRDGISFKFECRGISYGPLLVFGDWCAPTDGFGAGPPISMGYWDLKRLYEGQHGPIDQETMLASTIVLDATCASRMELQDGGQAARLEMNIHRMLIDGEADTVESEGFFVDLKSWHEHEHESPVPRARWHSDLERFVGRKVRITVEAL